MKRIAIGLGLVLLGAGLAAGFFYWRLRAEPAFMAGAPTVGPTEAPAIVMEIARQAEAPAPPPVGPAAPGPSRTSPAAPRPYHVALSERQVAALFVTQVSGQLGGQVGNLTVRIRGTDLLAAGRLQTTPLAGSVVSMAAVPSVGARGQLCLSLGPPSVGGQRIPEDVLQQMGGSVPRHLCMPARAAGLPGPLRSVAVANGAVVVDGVR